MRTPRRITFGRWRNAAITASSWPGPTPPRSRSSASSFTTSPISTRPRRSSRRAGYRPNGSTRPYQGRTLRTRDPWGIPLEFYVRMDRLPTIHQQYRLYHGVKPLRIDHFNMFSADVDASVAFWNEIGFRVTEYTEDEDSGRVWAAWMHRKGGVHDVAFTNGLGPRLHHTAFWVPTPAEHHRPARSDVDHRLCRQYRARTGAARHFQRLLPLCARSGRPPDRDSIARITRPSIRTWSRSGGTLNDPQRQTLWGAPAPRSWFEEGSTFAGVAPVPSQLTAQPIIAP